MQQIDFLPASYHRRRQLRQTTLWRRGALAAFLALIVLGVIHQQTTRRALQEKKQKLAAQAASMLAQLSTPQELKERLTRLDARAELLANLRLRVPPTRILAIVSGCRPKFVTLTELRIAREELAAGRDSEPDNRTEESAETSRQTPEQRDLQQLKSRRDRSALFVTLNGLAPDDVAIAAYLSALAKTGVFHDAQLLFTDRFEIRGNVLRRFGIRLQVATAERGAPGDAELAAVGQESNVASRGSTAR